MDWRDLVVDGYGRPLETLKPALKGVTKADLDKQPDKDSNSMGWIVWHLTRGQDSQIADLAGTEQVWIRDKWYQKFGRPADPADTGFGHSSEEVAAFRSPTAAVLLDYYRGVLAASSAYLRSVPDSDLARELDEPWFTPRPTVGVRLVSIMADCIEHAGEVAYLRGLLKGKGWLGY